MAPTTGLTEAVELLERSLSYTRGTLAGVRRDHLAAPTPCAGWTLARLLEHMEDALDAFTEAAAGQVHVEPVAPSLDRVHSLREKACALLGAWADARPVSVAVGARQVDPPLLLGTAALEIAVHGWDVAQATGRRTPMPDDLARELQPIAVRVVRPEDRVSRFGPARHPGPATSPGDALVAYLGRMTGPVGGNSSEPPSRDGVAP